MRILRIIARLNIGGPAIQAVTLTRRFTDAGHPSCLVTGRVAQGEGDMEYLAREKGVTPIMVPELGRALSAAHDWRAFIQIRRIIKRFRPHVIHTHTAKAGTLGRLAALSLGKPAATVHTFHGHVFHGYFSPMKTRVFILIERLLSCITDRIVVISARQRSDICDEYRVAGPRRVSIIPLGFDLAPFERPRGDHETEMRRRLLPAGGPQRPFLVGLAGRLTAIKNHDMLLSAVQRLKDTGRLGPLRFAIIGGGELDASLRATAEAFGIGGDIRFAGWQQDMPAVYGALDAVVLTSRNEGTPVTLIEAMAAGKPVVSTSVGGVPDLLGDIEKIHPEGFSVARRGLLVPPGQPDALAAALVFLRAAPDRVAAMAVRAQEWVSVHYGLDRLVADHERLYREILSDSR